MAERGRKGARTTETEGAKGEILSSRFSELSDFSDLTILSSHGRFPGPILLDWHTHALLDGWQAALRKGHRSCGGSGSRVQIEGHY